jgi:hypothetical protein
MRRLQKQNPWQAGLITATALSLVTFCAALLNQTGYAEWAFLLMFAAIWCLVSLFWANDSFNEESGFLLAGVMDENMSYVHQRLGQLESELEKMLERPVNPSMHNDTVRRLPVPKDQLV